MPSFLLPYLVTGGIFLALDLAWLTLMGGRFTLLVVAPAADAGDAGQAMLHGLLVGLAAYATYNLTNAATPKG